MRASIAAAVCAHTHSKGSWSNDRNQDFGHHSCRVKDSGSAALVLRAALLVFLIFTAVMSLAAAAADTSLPTVAITAPATGSTVSGTITVTANATDNVGVVGVQYKANGGNMGLEVTTAPYRYAADTTTVVNGSYSLTAVARDAAGNRTTSAPVTIKVANRKPYAGTPIAVPGSFP